MKSGYEKGGLPEVLTLVSDDVKKFFFRQFVGGGTVTIHGEELLRSLSSKAPGTISIFLNWLTKLNRAQGP